MHLGSRVHWENNREIRNGRSSRNNEVHSMR